MHRGEVGGAAGHKAVAGEGLVEEPVDAGDVAQGTGSYRRSGGCVGAWGDARKEPVQAGGLVVGLENQLKQESL